MFRPGPVTAGVRSTLGALALFVLTTVLPSGPAHAQDTIDLTMMFHGSTSGKIAPCG